MNEKQECKFPVIMNNNRKQFLKTLSNDRYSGLGVDDRYLRDNVVVSIATRNIGR